MQTKLYPYLAFPNAKEALDYYKRVFGATNIYRLSPQPEQAKQFGIPEGTDLDNLTMHAGFTVLGVDLQCADAFNGATEGSKQISLLLDVNAEDPESVKAADDFYDHLAASGEVDITMPFEEQFWGGKMGQFIDHYGVTWMLHSQPWSQMRQDR